MAAPTDDSSDGGTWICPAWWIWKDEDGKLHRGGDKPAAVHDEGKEEWYEHGRRHRLTGFAVLDLRRRQYEWWVDGKQCLTLTCFEKARDAYCKKHTQPIVEGKP